jgi:imidazolonepropionase
MMAHVHAVSIHGAEQVLRPPEDGLAFLRHDRAHELTLEPGAVRLDGGRITGFEPDARAPVQIDAGGGAVVPGFVDCHTHLPFAGWRAPDPAASDGVVLRQSRELAAEMLRDGTTTFECRGRTARDLRLAARLGGTARQTTVSTAAVAPEELARAVAETRARALALDAADVREHGPLARRHDLWLRVDAAEAALPAIALGARSADGLTELRAADVAALAESETAAVLLPVAELLHAEHIAPGRRLADAGAICAVATGCHPAEAPSASMPLAVGLAARLYGWSAKEALLACTLNAAWVLGEHERSGSLEPGKHADLLVLDGPVEDLPHRLGRSSVAVVIRSGEVVHVRPDQAWRVSGS